MSIFTFTLISVTIYHFSSFGRLRSSTPLERGKTNIVVRYFSVLLHVHTEGSVYIHCNDSITVVTSCKDASAMNF